MSREWSRMTDLIANLWNWLQSMPSCARTLNLRFSVTVPIINLLGFDFFSNVRITCACIPDDHVGRTNDLAVLRDQLLH